MLSNIHPYLTGDLLQHLDSMGHGDTVVLADAHFPAARTARRLLNSPGVSAPTLVTAVRTVFPLDDGPAVQLMTAPEGQRPVQQELLAAAGVASQEATALARDDFYSEAADAFLVVRTGETRAYGNVILRKGVVTPPHPEGH